MIKNWILAIRPKTLFASVSPVILGLALAFHYTHTLNILLAALTLLCTILLQIASNLANDYLDYMRGIDTEKRTGPVRVTQAQLITLPQMKIALYGVLALAFILGLTLMFSGGLPIIIIGIFSIYFAYGYSGGPYPLSHYALGEIAAFIFFGPVAVLGTFYLQTHTHNLHSLLMGIGAGTISATILAINNLRDRESDSLTTKKTIATLLGEKFQRKLALSLIGISVLVILINAYLLQNFYALIVLIIPLLYRNNWTYLAFGEINSTLNTTLANTAQYLFFYAMTISLTLVIL